MAEIGSTAQASRSETVEFLRSALTYHINSFRSRRDQNRRRAATTKLAIIAFGAWVTILLWVEIVYAVAAVRFHFFSLRFRPQRFGYRYNSVGRLLRTPLAVD